MRDATAELLRCPRCRADRSLTLTARESDEREGARGRASLRGVRRAQMQGLKTADWWFESGEVFFERMLSVMYDPALASESMDYVFCCEVLHHNDVANLNRTLEELYRVLKPGGTLFLVNGPMRFPLMLKRDHAEEVAEYEGNEHVHFFHQYYRAARRAGFEVERPWTPPGERPTTDTSGRDRAAGRSARCRAAATCARR